MTAPQPRVALSGEEIRGRLEANAKAFDDARAYGGVSISIWENGAKTCRDASALIAELEREIEKWKIAYDAVMESNDDKDDAIRDLNALLSSSRAEERWYVGTMNDAAFIINRPPHPAPVDHMTQGDPDTRVIAALGAATVETLAFANEIVAEHNATRTNARAEEREACAKELESKLQHYDGGYEQLLSDCIPAIRARATKG